VARRIVVGKRGNGDVGVFVSPSGVDAYTAPDSSLIMSITSKVSQLIAIGHAAGSTLVTLGLSQRPFVFLTSQYDFNNVFGHTTGPGPVRPSPLALNPSSTATINGSGASMSISSSLPVKYFVYSAVF
jgi:hypothetical protein